MTQEDIQARGRDLARYALLNEFKQRPFKGTDFNKTSDKHGGSFAQVFAQGNRELRSVFGMELIEARELGLTQEKIQLEEKLKRQAERKAQRENEQREGDDAEVTPAIKAGARKHQAPTTSKAYILRSALNEELIHQVGQMVDEEIPQDDREDDWLQEKNDILDWRRGHELAYQGVLAFLLCLILTNGQAIGDQDLRNYLKRLRIDDEWSPPHTPASMHSKDLTGLLDDFVRKRYLEVSARGNKTGAAQMTATQAAKRRQSQGPGGERQENEWRWGARAEVEFGQKGIADFIADIYQQAMPSQRRTPAQNATRGVSNNGFEIDRTFTFSRDKLMADIAKAAGVPNGLQDASRLEPFLGDRQPHEGAA